MVKHKRTEAEAALGALDYLAARIAARHKGIGVGERQAGARAATVLIKPPPASKAVQ